MKKWILCLLTCLVLLSCSNSKDDTTVYYMVEDFKITETIDSDVYTFRDHCSEKLEKI